MNPTLPRSSLRLADSVLHRALSWLLRELEINRTRGPVRVYYKFETGCWQARSTRQLQKVYRCR